MLLQSTQIIPMFTLPTERMLKSQANRAKYFLDSLSLALSLQKNLTNPHEVRSQGLPCSFGEPLSCAQIAEIFLISGRGYELRGHTTTCDGEKTVFYHRYHFSLQVIIPCVSACLRVLIRHVVKIKDKNFFMFFF